MSVRLVWTALLDRLAARVEVRDMAALTHDDWTPAELQKMGRDLDTARNLRPVRRVYAGHTSGGEVYGGLSKVSDRPAVGASRAPDDNAVVVAWLEARRAEEQTWGVAFPYLNHLIKLAKGEVS